MKAELTRIEKIEMFEALIRVLGEKDYLKEELSKLKGE